MFNNLGSETILAGMADAAPVSPEPRPDHGPYGINSEALTRLRSIEGQIRGIQKMIETERYCMDVVDQISAVRAALARVSDQVLRRHIETCVVNDLRHGSEADQDRVIDELMTVFARKLK